MKVLITGGAGFIGSWFVRDILAGRASGYEHAHVTVLDKFTYAGERRNLPREDDRLTVIAGDLADAHLTAELVPGHDLVVNFAAETHVDRSIVAPRDFMRTNALGVETLMHACVQGGIPRVLHVSTDEVYGSIERGRWDERAPVDPSSPYSAAKAAGDMIALAYARTYGLPVSVTRCGNNYGPRQFPEKLVPLFVTNLLEGRPVPLYGDGLNVRDWIHVSDHCAAIRLVAEKGVPGAVYHVAGTAELTNREMVDLILRTCGESWDRVETVPDRPGHDYRYSLDDSRLRALGYSPQVGVEEGMADTVHWYETHHRWWRPKKRESGLPRTRGV
ncbi:dTDP-glucose 4,6-dehydratase [Lipingzhangella halophila]|uniref:dTDP-glucose 4,6-dehydratase n=1 Tax=Lipingzhangella halophila TaxID=1783352 RepID=A0A7W7RLB5_9ACTN|nr:dTDP-glucose 4,6-dehydratase [Lipingzhangella halophila]MBB4934089.1 dTDP-glucose 4,6-dehydratase [Lipingzhangella halophila]